MFSFSLAMITKKQLVYTALAVLLVLFGVGLELLTRFYATHALAKTELDGVPIAGLTQEEILQKIIPLSDDLASNTITLVFEDKSWSASADELNLHSTTERVVTEYFSHLQQLSSFDLLVAIGKSLTTPTQLRSREAFDEASVSAFLDRVEQDVNVAAISARARLLQPGVTTSIRTTNGSDGLEVNRELSTAEIEKSAHTLTQSPALIIELPTTEIVTVLSDQQLSEFAAMAEKLVGKSILLHSEKGSITLTDTDLIGLAAFPGGIQPEASKEALTAWTDRYERQAQDAVFEFDPNTLVVTTFVPDEIGVVLDIQTTLGLLENAVTTLLAAPEETTTAPARESLASKEPTTTIELPLSLTPPSVTVKETNSIGISEKIGFGESEYDHSIPSRIHNVARTADIINNTIVAPGDEFSFNKTLGEVSAKTGFKPAYVILKGQTVLGDGGGVCQVSTTLFRALLNAGLPVTKRLPHSYRVSYYELDAKPGLDATVYSGEVDLRFINDTGHHLLVHTTTDSENKYMSVSLYGTSDGRSSEILDHKTWGATGPLPTEYVYDPSLRPGERKQIDWAVGGIKSSFRVVVKDAKGEVIQDTTYNSNYKPWSAKYLVGTPVL